MTLLTTFLDFSDTGILDIFIDEASVRMREMTIGAQSAGGGSLLKGQELATTFSFLRPNDLVWNYVVGNYLKGETPPPFDLLYWNSDGTNLPGPMYCWYLRNTYLENNLVEPGKVTVCGEKIDLGSIAAPSLPLRLARGPHRAVAGRLSQHAGAEGQAPLRARRLRPHRRRDQPAAEEEAQPLDRQERGAAGRRPSLARRGRRAPGQLVDRLVGLARRRSAASRSPRRRSPATRKYKAIEPAPGRYVKEKAALTPHGLRVAPAEPSDSSTGEFHEHRHRHRRRRPHRGRQVRRHARQDAGARARRRGHRQPARARQAHRRPDRRGHPRPGAHRRLGPEPGAPDGHQERPAAERSGADDQRRLRLGPEGGDARRAGDPRRRLRDRHRRRPGEHEPGAARAARLARRPAHGRLEDGRFDDHRRPLGRLQQVPHGHHGRERRQEVRRQPREAGRARARLAAEGGGGAGRRPLQGRDRAVLDRAEEGRPDRLRRRRVHQQEDQRRGARRPAGPRSTRPAR